MTSVSPYLKLPLRSEAEILAERAKAQRAYIDRLERKRNDPFFDDGLGDVWTAADFERSMQP